MAKKDTFLRISQSCLLLLHLSIACFTRDATWNNKKHAPLLSGPAKLAKGEINGRSRSQAINAPESRKEPNTHLWELQQTPCKEGERHSGGNRVFDGARISAAHPATGDVAKP